jgi:D-alanine-D-alanine ligase
MMEERGIAFTGSGSAASAAAFDKTRAKEMLRNRVRMADSRIVRGRQTIDEMLELYDRIVLKPVAGGSSRGLFFVDRGERVELPPNVPYLAEQFIGGRELTVGVVDMGSGPDALPPIEIQIDPGRAFDYEGKYLAAGTREICPADIPDPMRETAEQVALTAHTVLGCEGYSRTDMIAADDDHIYFLELNTLPGLTSSSLVPQELKVAGISFREFLEKQVELARQRAHAVSTPR